MQENQIKSEQKKLTYFELQVLPKAQDLLYYILYQSNYHNLSHLKRWNHN